MCFSASASFTAATLLLALGTVALRVARRPAERAHWAIPLLFGVQQIAEGMVWLSGGLRRRALSALAAAGLSVGAYLLYSLVANPIEVHAAGGHVDYHSPHFCVAASLTLYLLSRTVSLLLSSVRWIRLFGALALASSFVSYLFYARWFISVWCFFAALLSVLVALHFMARGSTTLQRMPS